MESSAIIDPFDERKEIGLFLKWVGDNNEIFNKYERELNSYVQESSPIPEFMFRSIDKLIVNMLFIFKTNGIQKPATTFYGIMREVRDKIKNKHLILELLLERIQNSVELLERYKNPKDDTEKIETTGELKRRGFI
ncbi:MAG: hypothetical protein AABY07_01070 [Nanoarchaeota archaeon]